MRTGLILALCLLGMASFLFSCSKTKNSGTTPSGASAKAGAISAKPAAAETPPAASPAAETPKPVAAVLAANIQATIQGFAISNFSTTIKAQDYSIGELGSTLGASPRTVAAIKAGRAFLDAWAKGIVPPELYLPEVRQVLPMLYTPKPPTPQTKPGILGSVTLLGASASMRIVLPRNPGEGRTIGVLSLYEVDKKWYVDSINLDPPMKEEPAFNPNALPYPFR